MKDISASLAMQRRARARIPGMSQLLSKRPDQFSEGTWPGYFDRASGAEVWDLDGNHYIDMSIGGIGANVLGYADPDVDTAVRQALSEGTSCSLNCPEEVVLAERLCQMHPWADKVRFARTGGEAMAIAVRIARAATGRDKVAFCGYHGWHDWYLAANVGPQDALGEHLLSGLEPRGVPAALAGSALPFRYNDIPSVEEIVNREGTTLAAIVMEPIRNEEPAPGFLERIRELADASGAALIFDEITAAFRLNCGGSHLILGVEPDVAVFSKALGNGYPMAALIGRQTVMEASQSTFISSTNWTERIGPVAALATIEKFERLGVSEHLVSTGEAVQRGWSAAATRAGLSIEIGGMAPLSHFQFEEGDARTLKALFVQLMLDEGFLASTDFYAMFAHTDEHVSAYSRACERAFELLVRLDEGGLMERSLRGRPAAAGFQRLN